MVLSNKTRTERNLAVYIGKERVLWNMYVRVGQNIARQTRIGIPAVYI